MKRPGTGGEAGPSRAGTRASKAEGGNSTTTGAVSRRRCPAEGQRPLAHGDQLQADVTRAQAELQRWREWNAFMNA